jgi:hypothetical protein
MDAPICRVCGFRHWGGDHRWPKTAGKVEVPATAEADEDGPAIAGAISLFMDDGAEPPGRLTAPDPVTEPDLPDLAPRLGDRADAGGQEEAPSADVVECGGCALPVLAETLPETEAQPGLELSKEEARKIYMRGYMKAYAARKRAEKKATRS